jgi:hypothetical protein
VRHISEEEMEQFLLKRLPWRRRKRVEEHLLVCHECIDRAEALAMILYFLRRAVTSPQWQEGQPHPPEMKQSRGNVITLPHPPRTD